MVTGFLVAFHREQPYIKGLLLTARVIALTSVVMSVFGLSNLYLQLHGCVSRSVSSWPVIPCLFAP
jgi:hypothetical protein